MLPLDAKATLHHWTRPVLAKVVDLKDFGAGRHPVERSILDLRCQEDRVGLGLLGLPWAGVLVSGEGEAHPSLPSIAFQGDPAIVKAGDVIDVNLIRSRIAVKFRRGDNGNVLFATERCNSYCLMCSQPPREVEDDWRGAQLLELVDLIDQDLPSIAISGGEPTLLGAMLPRIVEKCGTALPDTHVHILSNGRRFGDGYDATPFDGLHPSMTWGVPLYGDHYALHDYVVQSGGAFAETMRGLYALNAANQRIEIRVVLVRPTVERLMELARFISRNLPFVEHVALMGVEPIGFAKANHESLWVDPSDAAGVIGAAADFMTTRGIRVSIYNLPLCVLPDRLWHYATRSISNWKQDYLPACDTCSVKASCSGFFGWTTPKWTSRAISPIQAKEADYA